MSVFALDAENFNVEAKTNAEKKQLRHITDDSSSPTERCGELESRAGTARNKPRPYYKLQVFFSSLFFDGGWLLVQ